MQADRTTVAIAITFVLAACNASPSPPASTATATERATPAADLCLPDPDPCILAPGTYTTSRFQPQVTLTVGDGWDTVRYHADGLAILHRSPPNASISLASHPMSGVNDTPIGPGMAGVVEYLMAVRGLQVDSTSETTVGGQAAKQLDVRAATGIAGLFVLSQDRYNLETGAVARIYVMDVGQETMVIVIEPSPTATIDEAMTLAGPVIESVRFD